ncbi:MAG: ComEC/Rec2 family competence protein [Synergistaceae bacterium]|nr:ComEC/Rec2 family competence protein [Synergistaceae bacterium]
MTVLVYAPFLPVLAGLTALLALFGRVASWTLPLIALLTAMGISACSFRAVRKNQWPVAALMLICTLFSSLWVLFSLSPLQTPSFVDTTGTVVENRPWGRLYAVAVETPEGGFLLRRPFPEWPEGSRLRLSGVPVAFRGASESGFREDYYWNARGISARLTSVSVEPIPGGWNLHEQRYRLYRALSLHLPPLTGKYLAAAWTGKRDGELDKAHRAWGTSHLLAVSGFHVGVAMAFAAWFFRRGKWRVLGLSSLLWLYVFLAGFTPSAARAGLMLQIALLGELSGRPGSLINSVSLAAVLLLLASPYWFWDIGWRLSVLAALAIAAVAAAEEEEKARRLAWVLASPLVWLTTFPQVSAVFAPVPAVGLLVNFFALPVFAFILPVASALAALHLLGVPLTSFLLHAAEESFFLWGVLANAAARLVPWQMERSVFMGCAGCAALLAALCYALRVPRRNAVILVSLGILAAFALFPGP